MINKFYYPSRILILFFLGLAIYYQTFYFGFVFDDNMFIVNNPFIKNFTDVHHMWLTYPITRLIGMYSFAFNYAIGQLNPQSYHIFNFLVHLLATGLVWALARTLFKITKWLSSDNKLREDLAFIIALLFLVHPVQTQAVTYISQRFESMATVFYLGSVLCYLHGRLSSINTHKIFYFAGAICLAILGILTKETAATIPTMILAAELILFNAPKSKSRLLLPIIILGLIFLLFFVKIVRTDFNVYLHFSGLSGSHDGDVITSGKYVLTQMRVFLTFLRLLILPINQNVDYDYPLSTGLLNPPLTLAGLCLIGFITFLVFKLRQQWPLIAFGLAWILIIFSINTAPRIHVIFEHKLYLISFGFFLTAVCTLSTLIKNRNILLGLLIILVALLSVVSYMRNQVWRSDLTLWNDTVQKSPHKARPYGNRGYDYYKRGELIAALSDFNKAIEIDPEYAAAAYNRGVIYAQQGKFDQAMPDYNNAIKINPDYPEAYNNRGLIYYKENNFTQALSDYTRAIEIIPTYAEAYNNRGSAYDQLGNFTQAMSDYNKSIELNPNFAETFFNRGNMYTRQGNLPQAISDYTKAIAINPGLAMAYNNRGNAYGQQNDFLQAISDYNKVIEIDPGFADAFLNRGIIYDQQGNFIQAMSDYSKIIGLRPDEPEAYAYRGVIYAKENNFTRAMSDYNKAIGINPGYAEAYFDRAVSCYQLKEYDNAWADVHKAKMLGYAVDPGFVSTLKTASPNHSSF